MQKKINNEMTTRDKTSLDYFILFGGQKIQPTNKPILDSLGPVQKPRKM